ncbi:hypothetical protein Celaphus_00002983, partial [Cervus elaphus hippelaphus]
AQGPQLTEVAGATWLSPGPRPVSGLCSHSLSGILDVLSIPFLNLHPHPLQGEKNHGFEVLYHSVKQGPISTKELADFIRESGGHPRANWAGLAINSVLLAQVHEEFKQNVENCKEEAVGTLDAIQVLTGVSQLLPKSRENYLNRCMDQERLRRESTSQKEMDKAETKTRKAAESLRRLVEKYNSARSDFEQKMLDSALGLWTLRRTERLPCRKATMKRLRGAKAFRLPGLSRREREPPTAVDPLEPDLGTCPEVDEEGFTIRPDEGTDLRADWRGHQCWRLDCNARTEPTHLSSSDSDFDDEEPRKIYVHIKPASARAPPCSPKAAAAQLKATAGSLILPPGPGVSKNLFGPTLESALDHEDFTGSSSLGFTSSPSPFSSSSPENVEDSGLDSPSHAAPGPSPDSWVPRPGTPQSPPTCRVSPPESRGTQSLLPSDSPQPLAASPSPWGPEAVAGGDLPVPADLAVREGLAAPSRRPCSRKTSCPLMRSNGDLSRSLSPSPLGSSAPSSIPERPSFSSQTGHGVSRGPSPVVLGSQDALPVATAFTEYVHAYFRGHSPSCLARVTGELTMTFPAGIVRVFSGTPPPPVLSFRLSDPETKDFWLNMATLTETLQRQAEQNPAASYYNVVLLRYQVGQFSRPGPQSMPLQLSAHWQCGPTLTQVSVEYSYQPGATAVPTPLTNVQILLPVGEPVTNVRLQPAATWNLEEKRLLWKLPDVSEAGGSGRLSASWEPCSGPSTPSPVAAQFTSEGATLSGVDLELVGSGYRMSLVKRRFATGMPVPCHCASPEPGPGPALSPTHCFC